MAAGTGGHVFPALSIAEELMKMGVKTEWLGTENGMEHELLASTDIKIHPVAIKGLRGKGLARKLMAPFMLVHALLQSMKVIRNVKPDCVIGMGGFVSGPGGVATKLLRRPLIIHEQNAVAGVTNKILSHIADCVMEAFPATFRKNSRVLYTGNPVRKELLAIDKTKNPQSDVSRSLRILILGGSQGAAAINDCVPNVMADWKSESRPEIFHQTGKATFDKTVQAYQDQGLDLSEQLRVVPFINDMVSAYDWADIVICRSGASTVCELAAVGIPSILIPYPHHRDRQQTHNAEWLSAVNAALIVQQVDLTAELLRGLLLELHNNRNDLAEMARNAHGVAKRDASQLIANMCMEIAHA